MKKIIFLSSIALLLLAVGCSKNGDQDTSKNDDTAAVAVVDTLAMKTFPIRNENNPTVTIETDFGNMVLELYQDVAPSHADSFIARTNEGFYDGLEFFRIVNYFMIQTGDPQNNGFGNAGYFLPAEFSDLPHQDGTLSMARSSNPNSASSQFFICLSRNQNVASLDGKYTVFGQLIKGFDVLHKIGSVPCEANPNNPQEISHPVTPIMMNRVYVNEDDNL